MTLNIYRAYHGSEPDPWVGSGQEVLKNSRVKSGRARRCSKFHGSGGVGSGDFQISRARFGSPSDTIRLVSSEPTGEQP